MIRRVVGLALVAMCLVGPVACGDDDDDDDEDIGTASAAPEPQAPTVPVTGTRTLDGELFVGMTWQWQIQGEIDTSHDVDLYDIDLFDTDPATIVELREDGRYVVCYFSAGSHEDWRDDADAFPADVVGEPLGDWEGEHWLDVRSDETRDVLERRLDLAVDQGCDGVEPDNVTAVNNDTGFDITPDDQLDFNRFLADAAHERGLTIALKNDLEQIEELVDWFDFAVNEQCHQYDECDVYEPFLAAGKPVFNAEYASEFVDDPEALCGPAAQLGLSAVIFDLELDNSLRIPCP